MSIDALTAKIAESEAWTQELEDAATDDAMAGVILRASIELGDGSITATDIRTLMSQFSETEDEELDDAALEAAAGGGWVRRTARRAGRRIDEGWRRFW